MDEQQLTERFSQDIDNLILGDELASSEEMPLEYQQMLAVARALADPPIDEASQLRHTLRRRLLTQSQPRRATHRHIGPFWQRPFARVSLAVVAFMLAGILTTTPVSAWAYSMMLGMRSLSATVVPTTSQTATATPSLTVAPTAASGHGDAASGPQTLAAQLVVAVSVGNDVQDSVVGTPAVDVRRDGAVTTLAATTVPAGSNVVMASVVP